MRAQTSFPQKPDPTSPRMEGRNPASADYENSQPLALPQQESPLGGREKNGVIMPSVGNQNDLVLVEKKEGTGNSFFAKMDEQATNAETRWQKWNRRLFASEETKRER